MRKALKIIIKPLQAVGRLMAGDYKIFRIYSIETAECPPPPESEYDISEIPPGTSDSPYAGSESIGFGIRIDGGLASSCWFWYGERYKSRNFWPLKSDEAKLLGLETNPAYRGRGLAPLLIKHATASMRDRGFRQLYSRIWHSNRASVRAFRKAGWKEHALVVAFRPFRRKNTKRWILRRQQPE